jgi:hypothetical protein
MVGSKAMNLHGWRQLIEWSIQHASMNEQERSNLENVWKQLWTVFIDWIITNFKDVKPIGQSPAKPSTSKKSEESDEALEKYNREYSIFQDQIKAWRAKAAEL